MATGKKRHILVMFHAGKDYIDRSMVLGIRRQLDRAIKTPPGRTEIDLWLDSPGGDAHAAYKLALDLRARANTLRVAIPDVAKSAATLLALAMDEIYLAAGSELGPLDIQLSHPHRESEVISGLDVVGSLSYISEFAIQLAVTGGAEILRYTGLSRKDVLGPMLDFVAQYLRPCIEQIDPHLTRRAYYQLQIGEKYAVDLLRRRSVAKVHRLNEDQAKRVAYRLVNHYPVHEFVIERASAKDDLELPIIGLETYDKREDLDRLHDSWCIEAKSSIVQLVETPIDKKKSKPARKKAAAKKGGSRGADTTKIKGVA